MVSVNCTQTASQTEAGPQMEAASQTESVFAHLLDLQEERAPETSEAQTERSSDFCSDQLDQEHMYDSIVDSSYEPTNLSLGDYTDAQKQNQATYKLDNLHLDACCVEDLIHDIGPEAADDIIDDQAFVILDGPTDALSEQPCLAYISCLLRLAPEMSCSVCSEKCAVSVCQSGSAVILLWKCSNGHVGRRWSSQPRLIKRGLNLGDFSTAMNILLSGNNYRKVALLFRFMGLRIVCETVFSQIQRLYCLPAINTFWKEVNAVTLAELKDKPLVIAGDGRNDSPGHSAQYCTYTSMEHNTGRILDVQVLDKRELGGNSSAMEKEGLVRSLHFLQSQELQVVELVTDAHASIAATMRKDFPDIVHQWDVWHGAKNFSKKLHAKADIKANAALKPWVGDVVKHFWYCSEKAAGSTRQFLGRWRGILHHTTGHHEWLDGEYSEPRCEHDDMTEPTDGKSWLEAGGPAHRALGEAVSDKRFLNTLPHYVNFRHTGELEVFHQHILMYASKRFAFSPPVYKARNTLAALDFHMHSSRALKRDADGKIVHRRMYNKRTKAWFAVPMKVAKTYSYIKSLQLRVLQTRATTPGPLCQPAQRPAGDPREIAPTLAGSNVPPLGELVERQQSRMKSTSK